MTSVLIMAGGSGKRLWPLSNEEHPKQFMKLDYKDSMIVTTVKRLSAKVPLKKIFISTTIEYVEKIYDELSMIPRENIIIEPAVRDTAAAIIYGSMYIKKRMGNETLIICASDHIIKREDVFISALEVAENECESDDSIITLGIVPERAETNYGYIEVQDNWEFNKAYKAENFKEKPDCDLAKEYYSSGKYLWNSGIFVFKIDTIMKYYKMFLPKHFEIMEKMEEAISKKNNIGIQLSVSIKELFLSFEKISIDYGIMEKIKYAKVIPVDIGWNDVGSYKELEKILGNNKGGNSVVSTQLNSFNSKNNFIVTDSFEVGLVGVENLIVVQKGNHLLVCHKNSKQNIKKLFKD